jgi:hypothetical protein
MRADRDDIVRVHALQLAIHGGPMRSLLTIPAGGEEANWQSSLREDL